jgi:hypothetical protein
MINATVINAEIINRVRTNIEMPAKYHSRDTPVPGAAISA